MRAPARLIPDASVAVKWFVQEDDSDIARRLLASFRGKWIAPDLILSECVNAAWKRIRKGELSSERAEEIVLDIPKFVVLARPGADLALRALFIAEDLDHPAYDCFYLAFAERESALVVTADKRLLNKTRRTPWGDLIAPLKDAARDWAK